jgi:hypothetical protein
MDAAVRRVAYCCSQAVQCCSTLQLQLARQGPTAAADVSCSRCRSRSRQGRTSVAQQQQLQCNNAAQLPLPGWCARLQDLPRVCAAQSCASDAGFA